MIQRLAGVVLLMMLVIQLVPAPYRIEPAQAAADDSVLADPSVPGAAKAILRRSCMDCHSEQTQVPWYGRVAPVSWMLARDVERGRAAMNLSRWRKQPLPMHLVLATAACENARSGRMPPSAYQMMHPEARLSPEQAGALCQWSGELMEAVRAKRSR